MNVKNIIFDLGVVLLDLNQKGMEEAFSKLGAHNFSAVYTTYAQDPIFDLLERGQVTEDEFRDRLRKILGITATDRDIDSAWSNILVGIKPEVISLLQSLSAHYRTFILSNTNEIHMRSIDEHLQKVHSLTSLDDLVEKAFISSRMGARKPERKIFDDALAHAGISRENTIFIDDHPKNVEGARAAGIVTYQFNIGEQIAEKLPQYLEESQAL